jgi:hypothetical protein
VWKEEEEEETMGLNFLRMKDGRVGEEWWRREETAREEGEVSSAVMRGETV